MVLQTRRSSTLRIAASGRSALQKQDDRVDERQNGARDDADSEDTIACGSRSRAKEGLVADRVGRIQAVWRSILHGRRFPVCQLR